MNGASVEARTNNDETPLWMAVRAQEAAVCDYLLQCKCDPNTSSRFNGDTLLHIACRNHDQKICKLLLKFSADMNIPNIKGVTPFNCVTGDESGWISMQSSKPNCSPEEKQKIQNFLMVLFTLFCVNDNVHNVKALLETGEFQISASPTQRLAPLTHALISNAHGIANLLMSNGAQLFDLDVSRQNTIFFLI